MKKNINMTKSKAKNNWAFVSLLAELAVPVLLVKMVLVTQNPLRIVVALIAAVMVVNILAKLYVLITK